jgi:hypothetical protein
MRAILLLILSVCVQPVGADWAFKALGGRKLHVKSAPQQGAEWLALVDTACLGATPAAQHRAADSVFGPKLSVKHKSWGSLKTAAIGLRVDSPLSAEEAEQLAAHPCIHAVTENSVFQIASAGDPMLDQQAFRAPITQNGAERLFYHPLFGINQPAVIAVVDTGIQLDHPDLFSRIWRGSDGSAGFNFVSGTADASDDNGHGTHVAGLAGAQRENGTGVRGIMGEWSQLMAVKTQDKDGSGTLAQLVNGIRWAADHGAEVINISVAGKDADPTLQDAVQYAVSKNAVVVAAAGNDGVEVTAANLYTPAGFAKDINGMLSVGAFDAVTLQKPAFSNFSPTYVEISAPGAAGTAGILSTFYQSRYIALDGTSQSTPIVSGAAGLAISYLKTHNRPYTPAMIENMLELSAVADSTLSSSFAGGRRLDARHLGLLLLQSTVVDSTGGFDGP